MVKAKTFTGRLEHLRGNLGWVIAKVPFDVQKTWGARRMKVKITVNGHPFRTSLFPTRGTGHFILVNKKMQKAAKIKAGDAAKFTVVPDTEERAVKNPPELERILKQEKVLRHWYEQLSHSMRYYIANVIAQPRSAASREKRAQRMAEQLFQTMEAEIELSAQIRAMLDSVPHARRGWDLLTPIQRRQHLMGFFHYRMPEARQRRFEKAINDAVRAATR
jgi:uncharacterized protein YdeI (YjbR/CyaY-like superfamily)